MKLPLSIGPRRPDTRNGGEFCVLKDADGAWIGDIRAAHVGALLAACTPQPEAGRMTPAVYLALRTALNHIEPGWENCATVAQAWLAEQPLPPLPQGGQS